MDELRIVLLGKQGAGKSASGNTLLRTQSFHTAASSERVTEACSMGMFTVDKQTIKVIDTPGWCDSSQFETDIKQEITKCINMSSPGPHVFLLVLPIGRFTNEEINTVMNILKEFGDEVTNYMIVLFTKGDDLEDRPIEDYLKEVHPNLKTIIQICGKRYHVFNNRDKKNSHQVSSLLKKINEMVERNEGNCYTTVMYQKVKDQQMDDRRGQQFRREADNSVQDKNKNLSVCENGGRRNRCNAEGDDSERKSISQDTKGFVTHEGLKNRKRDVGDKNEDKRYTAILEDKSERNVIEEHNRSQSREHRGLKQGTREEGKRDLDKNDDRYYVKFVEEPGNKMSTHSCDVSRRRNVEKSSQERQEIQHFDLVKIPQEKLQEMLEENSNLIKERNELQKRLKKKERELEQTSNHLEQLQQKVNQYEQLKQEEKRQREVIERLMQENQEGKRKSMALQNDFAQMEEMLTKQKTTDEKTKTNGLFEMFSKLKKYFE